MLATFVLRETCSIDCDAELTHRIVCAFTLATLALSAVVVGIKQQLAERVLQQESFPGSYPTGFYGHVGLSTIALVFLAAVLLNAAFFLLRNKHRAALCSLSVFVPTIIFFAGAFNAFHTLPGTMYLSGG